MCVHMVRKGCVRFEATLTNITLVRSVLRVRLHVPGQEIALWAGVVTVAACQLR